MISGSCTEKHILVPFSHKQVKIYPFTQHLDVRKGSVFKIQNFEAASFSIHSGEYGVTSAGRQELTLVKVSSHNDRIFYHSKIFV